MRPLYATWHTAFNATLNEMVSVVGHLEKCALSYPSTYIKFFGSFPRLRMPILNVIDSKKVALLGIHVAYILQSIQLMTIHSAHIKFVRHWMWRLVWSILTLNNDVPRRTRATIRSLEAHPFFDVLAINSPVSTNTPNIHAHAPK